MNAPSHRWGPGLLALGLACSVVGCTTGNITSDRHLSAEAQAWAARQTIPLRLNVVPATEISPTNSWQMRSVANLATQLHRTGLFHSVTTNAPPESADLQVVARKAYGVLQCGTGLPLTKASLGLFRDDVRYAYTYEFEFAGPGEDQRLPFTALYQGRYRLGFWPAREDGFVELLRHDLARQGLAIEALTRW